MPFFPKAGCATCPRAQRDTAGMDFVVDARPENEPLAPSAEGAPSRKRRRKRSGNAARERMLASLVFSEGGASAAIEEADADAFGAAAAASDGEGDEGLSGGEQPSGGESGGEEEAEEEGEEEAEEEEEEEGGEDGGEGDGGRDPAPAWQDDDDDELQVDLSRRFRDAS